MKIITICSTLDFVNYTRRATLEAISKKTERFEIIMYASLSKIFRPSQTVTGIIFHRYHFWIPGKFRKYNILTKAEHFIRRIYWTKLFKGFDVVFFTDPNQYYLLQYITVQKIAYLIRDPHCLFDPKLKPFEQIMLRKADIIYCTAKALADRYIEKYYQISTKKTVYWPNTVDINIWDFNKFEQIKTERKKVVAGILGNLTTYTDDFKLLDLVTDKYHDIQFELSGKISLKAQKVALLQKILKKPNFIVNEFIPFDDLPGRVLNWDIGLIIADPEIEISYYIHNNKQFQYVAMGKPFVTFNIHNDYEDFGDMVFLARDNDDFLNKISLAIIRSRQPDAISKGIGIASRNCADVRAEQFINELNKLKQ
jgi:hypothetical protein